MILRTLTNTTLLFAILLSSMIYATAEDGNAGIESRIEPLLRMSVQLIGQQKDANAIRESVRDLYFSFNFQDGIQAGLAAARAVNQEHGPFIGVEFLGSMAVGESLFAFYYLQKFQSNGLLWRFMAYRPSRDQDKLYVIAAKWGAAGSLLTEMLPASGGQKGLDSALDGDGSVSGKGSVMGDLP